MSAREARSTSATPALVLSVALSAAFLFAVGIVLRPFVVPLLWAGVLTIATWPLFVTLRSYTPARPWLAALGLTLALGLVLLLVSIPLPVRLADEVVELGKRISTMDTTQLISSIHKFPVVGSTLAHQLETLQGREGAVTALLSTHQATLLKYATQAVVGIVDTLTIIFMSLVGCFILYLHGERLVIQAQAIVSKLGAHQAASIFHDVTATVRGAAYSVIATALAQGTLAGIGYSLVGAPLPVLLAVVTMVLSLLPFGAPLLYVPVAAYLVFFADVPWYYGVGLLVWGIACVSTVDNLLRAVLISQATRVSAIVVFIGVVGGVLAFGLLGVFIGPALIGVAQTLWVEFSETE
jgi:predicted PurR-regulated permease PerM